ncbi:PREDICTED: uncharacterized protein LOC107187668 [Dufourea novaeangliae]|uniref:uncharacterized protein LOC107187668 n=1 Tax=Dufourea novaeangliae TaxID=178035 RepID=UPI0007672506|nr:PREDICTED: uncharacterized protein LOC107187668 [Dufourea novaeangliae]
MRGTVRRKSVLRICVLIFVCRFDLSVGLPAEQPTKFTLNTGDAGTTARPASQATSRLDQGRELLGRVADGIRIGAGRFVNSVTLARNIIVDQAETLASESQNSVATVLAPKIDTAQNSVESITSAPVINTRPNARETVRLESENGQSPLEKPIPKPFMSILESFFRPTPLLDGIKDHEKYGNTGDKFIGIGRALVSGFEGLSNFLNAVVDLPRNAAKKTSRGITEALNNVGARLVGLQ